MLPIREKRGHVAPYVASENIDLADSSSYFEANGVPVPYPKNIISAIILSVLIHREGIIWPHAVGRQPAEVGISPLLCIFHRKISARLIGWQTCGLSGQEKIPLEAILSGKQSRDFWRLSGVEGFNICSLLRGFLSYLPHWLLKFFY
jgi:hypothetical protein